MGAYALLGESSFQQRASKYVQMIPFLNRSNSESNKNESISTLRLRFVDATSDAVERCLTEEFSLQNYLCDQPKRLILYDNDEQICINVDLELSSTSRINIGYKELSSKIFWSTRFDRSCFIFIIPNLQSENSIVDHLAMHVDVYQPTMLDSALHTRISINTLNVSWKIWPWFSISINKRTRRELNGNVSQFNSSREKKNDSLIGLLFLFVWSRFFISRVWTRLRYVIDIRINQRKKRWGSNSKFKQKLEEFFNENFLCFFSQIVENRSTKTLPSFRRAERFRKRLANVRNSTSWNKVRFIEFRLEFSMRKFFVLFQSFLQIFTVFRHKIESNWTFINVVGSSTRINTSIDQYFEPNRSKWRRINSSSSLKNKEKKTHLVFSLFSFVSLFFYVELSFFFVLCWRKNSFFSLVLFAVIIEEKRTHTKLKRVPNEFSFPSRVETHRRRRWIF